MEYDTIICVGPHHRENLATVVRALRWFSQTQKIFIVCASHEFDGMRSELEDVADVCFVDENAVVPGVSLDSVRVHLKEHKRRAGWYFQQFLKMGLCHRSDIADHYLIWDADTVMLSPMQFFDEDGKALVKPSKENHRPYFDTMQNVLGRGKLVDYSFVSQHLMVNKSYMQELIEGIQPQEKGWAWAILDGIEPMRSSGFSEYETYGNFIADRYPQSFRCRPVRYIRNATTLYGSRMRATYLLHLMSFGIVYATFELWHRRKASRVIPARAKAMKYYLFCRINPFSDGTSQKNLKAANSICR